MNISNRSPHFDPCSYLRRRPNAYATIHGNGNHPTILGIIRFYSTTHGTLVVSEVRGLPREADPCLSPIFALHIHGGNICTGTREDAFANAGTHYNPNGCPHPYHAGDLPPLFGADGYAFGATLTNRFTVDEILGKTVILHASPDDFTTQPSGNAGLKLACGEIRAR